MEWDIMIKNLANLILCLVIIFISSANAADGVVDTIKFTSGNAVNLYKEHSRNLQPLSKLKIEDCIAWNDGLANAGYLKSHSTESHMSFSFYTDYGIFCYRQTQKDAQLPSWEACDNAFEKAVVTNVTSYIEREQSNIKITSQQIEKISSFFNPGRGTVRGFATTNKFHILALDEKRLFKLHMNLTTSSEVSLGWIYSRYTAKMNGNLDFGIYEFMS